MDTYLETERLALRRFTADDANLLIELDSDPAVMRYLTGGNPTAPELVRDRYLPKILAATRSGAATSDYSPRTRRTAARS